MSIPTAPSPYATHADLNQLRREIQADVRFEVRELTTELRATVRELNNAQVTSKQFNVTTALSFINAACMLWYAIGSR